MDFRFFDPWHEVLPRDPGHVVAFGGDGPRSVLLALARGIWAAEGLPVSVLGPGEDDPGDGTVVMADAGRPPSAWPRRTSLAVLTVSVAGVGSRADATLPADRLPAGLEPWALLEWGHLAERVLADADGIPEGVPVVLGVGGLEEQPDSIGLFEFTGQMMADPRLAVVVFVSQGEDGVAIRACCRAEEA